MTAAPDRELLAAWQGGDAEAGSALIRRHAPALMRFFRGKVSDDEVEDLCQQTLSMCVSARDEIDDDGRHRSFRAFLFTVARGRLLNHYRRLRTKGDPIDPLTHSIAGITGRISDVLAIRERAQRVRAALAELPLDAQISLELVYWHGLSTAEVGSVLEVPVGTVKARIHRARARLREILGDDVDLTPDDR